MFPFFDNLIVLLLTKCLNLKFSHIVYTRLKVILWNCLMILESCTRYHRRGSKRNFRWIWWSFNVDCTIAKSFKRYNPTATSIRRATRHINRLCESVSTASHESINLEEFLVDVAKCGCDGIYHWPTMLTNYPVLLGNRSRSKRFKIGRFWPWTLPIQFHWMSNRWHWLL